MKLEPELRADFMTEAVSEDRPASQNMYDNYLRRKVKIGHVSMRADHGLSNDMN
jgi:hypothetical protein